MVPVAAEALVQEGQCAALCGRNNHDHNGKVWKSLYSVKSLVSRYSYNDSKTHRGFHGREPFTNACPSGGSAFEPWGQ